MCRSHFATPIFEFGGLKFYFLSHLDYITVPSNLFIRRKKKNMQPTLQNYIADSACLPLLSPLDKAQLPARLEVELRIQNMPI